MSKHGYLSDDGRVLLKVRFSEEWDEYAIQWFENGVYQEDKTGYTDDFDDAIGTAQATIDHYNSKGARQ